MVKEQVNPIPLVIDAEPLLAADEGEIIAQLKQETFHMLDQCLLQLGLGVFILEVEKLQHKRVLEFLLGRDNILGSCLGSLGQHRSLVL